MRWYNPAMRKSFQFSIRQCLLAIPLFGVALWAFAPNRHDVYWIQLIRTPYPQFVVGFTSGCAAIGTVARTPITAALIGFVISVVLVARWCAFWTNLAADTRLFS
jgi:hypothetical protein